MTDTCNPLSLVWLRRDLRLHDHAALSTALQHAGPVQPIFVFDTDILTRFTNKQDRRLSFIARTLEGMHNELKKRGGGLLILHGSPKDIVPKLSQVLNAERVVAGEDYEPSTIARDEAVASKCELVRVRDHLIMSPDEIKTGSGDPYKVFTPYSKAWHAKLDPSRYAEYEVKDKGRYADIAASVKAVKGAGLTCIDADSGAASMLEQIDYELVDDALWRPEFAQKRLRKFAGSTLSKYKDTRDMLAIDGTSRLSPYLRFGQLSIRELFRAAEDKSNNAKWISELIWREFYAMILYHYPESVEKEWNETYRSLEWSHDEKLFDAWKQGKTGYPVVDAGMRQLLEEGWMHNRARMIVASFLTKDMHIDWRLGEEHFAQYLMDYEQASNVGGWQWSASTGTDAQPYFRIFNPILQGLRFDPKGEYVRNFIPELDAFAGADAHEPWKVNPPIKYPAQIVDHSKERNVALAAFKKAKGEE